MKRTLMTLLLIALLGGLMIGCSDQIEADKEQQDCCEGHRTGKIPANKPCDRENIYVGDRPQKEDDTQGALIDSE
jgi:hypothetical protein